MRNMSFPLQSTPTTAAPPAVEEEKKMRRLETNDNRDIEV